MTETSFPSTPSTMEIIRYFAAIAPYLNEITSADIGISVWDGETCIAYVPSHGLDLGLKPGDRIKPGGASDICIREKRRVVKEFSRENSPFGVPFIATAYPFFDENRNVVGQVVTSETTDNLNTIRETSDSLQSASNQLAVATQDLSQHARELAQTGRNLAELAQATIDTVKNTDSIITFINDIASRTNILGLNAAIEAARIGDLGRGFGVVADEVRKLAVHTANSARQINLVLSKIEESILKMSEQTMIVDQSVHKQVDITQEIASATQELFAMAQELSKFTNRIIGSAQ